MGNIVRFGPGRRFGLVRLLAMPRAARARRASALERARAVREAQDDGGRYGDDRLIETPRVAFIRALPEGTVFNYPSL
jgi:hypothetical protein